MKGDVKSVPVSGTREVEMDWKDVRYIFRTLAHAMADALLATLVPAIPLTCLVAMAYQDDVICLCFMGSCVVVWASATVTAMGRRLGWW